MPLHGFILCRIIGYWVSKILLKGPQLNSFNARNKKIQFQCLVFWWNIAKVFFRKVQSFFFCDVTKIAFCAKSRLLSWHLKLWKDSKTFWNFLKCRTYLWWLLNAAEMFHYWSVHLSLVASFTQFLNIAANRAPVLLSNLAHYEW